VGGKLKAGKEIEEVGWKVDLGTCHVHQIGMYLILTSTSFQSSDIVKIHIISLS